MQVVSPNTMFGVSRLQGGRLGFLWIKGLQPRGVSLYMLEGMGGTSPIGNMMQSVVLDGNPLDEDDGNLLNEFVLDA